jgi:hypothetical protein
MDLAGAALALPVGFATMRAPLRIKVRNLCMQSLTIVNNNSTKDIPCFECQVHACIVTKEINAMYFAKYQ